MNIPASNIVTSGDSAGGNVAIALLRYISSPEGNNLPSPLAALLWSPSVDYAKLRNSHDQAGVSLIHDTCCKRFAVPF